MYLPPIPGDPGGMRAAAKRLQRWAGDLHALSASTATTADKMLFESRYASTLRDEISTFTTQIDAQAAILTTLASVVRQRADEVEEAQQQRLETLRRLRLGNRA